MSKADQHDDLDDLERRAQGHAHPTPIVLEALCLLVREIRALRADLAAQAPKRGR